MTVSESECLTLKGEPTKVILIMSFVILMRMKMTKMLDQIGIIMTILYIPCRQKISELFTFLAY